MGQDALPFGTLSTFPLRKTDCQPSKQPIRKEYLLFYRSVRRLITLQLKYAFANTFWLLVPFFAVLLFHSIDIDTVVRVLKIYFCSALFLFEVEETRYLGIDNLILIFLSTSLLFCLNVLPFVQILALPLSILVSFLLMLLVYNSYRK
jgi:hypothetical protein